MPVGVEQDARRGRADHGVRFAEVGRAGGAPRALAVGSRVREAAGLGLPAAGPGEHDLGEQRRRGAPVRQVVELSVADARGRDPAALRRHRRVVGAAQRVRPAGARTDQHVAAAVLQVVGDERADAAPRVPVAAPRARIELRREQRVVTVGEPSDRFVLGLRDVPTERVPRQRHVDAAHEVHVPVVDRSLQQEALVARRRRERHARERAARSAADVDRRADLEGRTDLARAHVHVEGDVVGRAARPDVVAAESDVIALHALHVAAGGRHDAAALVAAGGGDVGDRLAPSGAHVVAHELAVEIVVGGSLLHVVEERRALRVPEQLLDVRRHERQLAEALVGLPVVEVVARSRTARVVEHESRLVGVPGLHRAVERAHDLAGGRGADARDLAAERRVAVGDEVGGTLERGHDARLPVRREPLAEGRGARDRRRGEGDERAAEQHRDLSSVSRDIPCRSFSHRERVAFVSVFPKATGALAAAVRRMCVEWDMRDRSSPRGPRRRLACGAAAATAPTPGAR